MKYDFLYGIFRQIVYWLLCRMKDMLYNRIDKNKDGKLEMKELEQFAREIEGFLYKFKSKED